MNKKSLWIVVSLSLLLLVTLGPQNVAFATDRTSNFGILISAWTCDENNITPATVKAMLDEAYTRKGIVFQAVKITYGYDPDLYSGSYVAGRIHTWVDYFDDYYDVIYVATRTTFHTGEKLTYSEASNFYYYLANYLADHSDVKVFIGEEEVEANQTCPHCGDPTGNNLAYDSFEDMADYIDMLYDLWNSYSTIPFTFESIPMGNVINNASGTFYINRDCWFFDSVKYSDYWDFIDTHQEVFAINEWRHHYGTTQWASHCHSYNYLNEPDKQIFIGETFNLDYTETEYLIDEMESFYSDLSYFFWWQTLAVEPIYSQCDEVSDYFYFEGGWEGHSWAMLQKKIWGNMWGSYLGSFCTYSESTSDKAYTQKTVSFTWDRESDCKLGTLFNIDMFTNGDAGGGNYAVLACARNTNDWSKWHDIVAVYDDDGEIYLGIRYVKNNAMTTWICATPIYENIWYYAEMRRYYDNLWFNVYYYLPSGQSGGTCIYYDGSAYNSDRSINNVFTGADGGQLVKYYNGNWSFTDDGVALFSETWESGSMSGWSNTYTEPSYVHVDNYLRYENGPHWILDQIKS
ncbi:MAG: hypothetical protein NWE94_01800 [Candidatus Bathyarchaeota archaeon]|nr:hypothetical protein [Candidatus Bathyarchaeota archaeon]